MPASKSQRQMPFAARNDGRVFLSAFAVLVPALFFCFLCVGSLCLSLSAFAAERPREVSISTFDNAEPLVKPMERVITEAYRRLGIKATVTRLPLSRSLAEANAGHYDAELGRVPENEKEAPNLLVVSEPVGTTEYRAYTLREHPIANFKGWQTLKQSGLRIGIRLGARVPEANLGDAITDRGKTQEALLAMLIQGRIDVVIGTAITTRKIIADLVTDKIAYADTIMELNPPLQIQHFYHLVHVSHADLIGPLNAELVKMNRDGTIARIWTESVKEDSILQASTRKSRRKLAAAMPSTQAPLSVPTTLPASPRPPR